MKLARTPLLTAAFGAAMLFAATAGAHDFTLGALTIGHPWARASAGPAPNGAAYLTVQNAGEADRLVAVSGDVAERVELHTHRMENNVMQMRQVDAIDVPAGGAATLQPGGLHVMLIGLKQPLKEGEHFPLVLTFEKAGEVSVEVTVEGVGSMGPQGGAGHGGMHHGTTMPAN